MGLSARHVGELVQELAPLVTGARVRDVQAHPPRDLLLVLAGPGGEPIRRLRLSVAPEAARLHLQIGRVRRHAGPPGPFYRRARELLTGSTLIVLAQPAGDRAVRLGFQPESGTPVALVAEFFGRHANLVLLDRGERVLAALVQPAQGSAAAARLAPGTPYSTPAGRPPDGRPDPPLAATFPEPPPAGGQAALAPLSWRVEAALGLPAEKRWDEAQRHDLLRRVERRLASARALVGGLEERERVSAGAERVRMDAELLTAHLAKLSRGMLTVELEDAHDPAGGTRRIALDPRFSPQKNAERLFARYQKLRRTRERLPDELAAARAQVELLESFRARVAEPGADRAALEEEALATGLLRPRQKAPERRRPEPRRPYLRFRSSRGTEIRVGRSARDNDALTRRHARGRDVWLHTAEAAGSHVVLRIERGHDPVDEDVLDAAHLAVHFSPLRGARRADVHVARCGQVKKPKGAPAGLVSLAGGRVRTVRIEPERLERLLATRRAGEPGSAGRGPDA